MELMLASDQTMVRTNYFLTQSFRFGSEIAFTANTCLVEDATEVWKIMRSNG